MRDQRNDLRRPGFTLIEVLVVVGIISLMTAMLLPALERSRELSRATVCLSHLKQQGYGMKMYSADFKGVLPWAGSFRFSLMEGKYYLGYGKTKADGTPDPTWVDWAKVNIGVLFPKYNGNTADLFYCPNNRAVEMDSPNGKARLKQLSSHPKFSDPDGHSSHDFPYSPFTSYCYAPPVVQAKSPRDAGSKMYPEESVRYAEGTDKNGLPYKEEYPYWKYLNDTASVFDPSFPGPIDIKKRGKHSLHALVSDGYYAGEHEGDHRIYEGYHLKSYNVLFGDFHAKRVVDPNGIIHAARLNPIRPDYYNENTVKVYRVWDYFSQNP